MPGCARAVVVDARIYVGGEPLLTGWCGPHAAEYRVDEATR